MEQYISKEFPDGASVEAALLRAKSGGAIDIALQNKLGGIENTDYPGCYYRMVDGAVEWFNPPMESRTEYRTTERYYGNPVYTQELYFSGALPNNGGSQAIFPLPVASTNIIDIQCTIVNDTTHEVQSLPAISDSGSCIAFVKVLKLEDYDNWCFRITTFADLSQWVCKKMVVKYTKTGG